MLRLPIISAWDPRTTSSGSIDPLGALRAYNAIATFLLPGVTTVTTRARYLSWVCAGLRVLDEAPNAPRGGQAGRARRQRVLAWERLIVLATGQYASEIGASSEHPAWRGLRGISYVRKAIAERKRSVDFDLLKNQAGVGGVGTYWVTMVNGGLVDDAPAELTVRGTELADAFLGQPHAPSREKLRSIVCGLRPTFPSDKLSQWGEGISLDLGKAHARERRLLGDAFLEPQTHRRLATALGGGKHANSDQKSFERLQMRLKTQKDILASQLAAAVAVTRAFEAVHSLLLDCFDRLLAGDARGTLEAGARRVGVTDAIGQRGKELALALESNAELLPRSVAAAVREFHNAVQPILSAKGAATLVAELVRHHERVQAGKFDASRQPKLPWLSLPDRALVVAPRYQLQQLPEPRPEGSFTHPYRVESFGALLTEVGAWGHSL